MFKDLAAYLTVAILSSIPVTATPQMSVHYQQVETQVAEFIKEAQNKSFTVECGTGEFSVSSDMTEPHILTCLSTPVESTTQFNTEVSILVKDLDTVEFSGKVLEPTTEQLRVKAE